LGLGNEYEEPAGKPRVNSWIENVNEGIGELLGSLLALIFIGGWLLFWGAVFVVVVTMAGKIVGW